VEGYRLDDAALDLVTSGSITCSARYVVDRLREGGEAVGLIKVKMFRPFPGASLRGLLGGVERVAVLDRNLSPGRGGIFAEELKAALYSGNGFPRPEVYGYVLGLGGRDVTPPVIEDIVKRTWQASGSEREDLWVGLNL
jgi:pyruvate/2-oxoacid:ferredoxin oxidoreductase alpha subunit